MTFILKWALMIAAAFLILPAALLLFIFGFLLNRALSILSLAKKRRSPKAPKILVVQSADPIYLLNAMDQMRNMTRFKDCQFTVFCRERSDSLKHFVGNQMINELIIHHETQRWLRHLIQLRMEHFDSIAVFFTGNPSFWKVKVFALFLGGRTKLIFDEKGNCSILSLRMFLDLMERDIMLRGVFQSTFWKTHPLLRWFSENYTISHAKRRPRLSRLSAGSVESMGQKNFPSLFNASDRQASLNNAKQAITSIAKAALDSFLGSSSRLKLPSSPDPEISIVIVLYNRAELTLQCLRSLMESAHNALEIVLVDNASADLTESLLNRLDGAVIIRNAKNQHFLKGANQGAQAARGKYILFLNNDTQVLPGTIGAAANTIKSTPEIGAVGAKLILPDGKLQEAGSIVWQDGSCVGYGRGDNPQAPEFMFRREVDYCSGAFLLTSRDLFASMGGFDNAYEPFYYEETDYCLRLRKRGLKVIYEPEAIVFHYEFASSTSQDSAQQWQSRHQNTFVENHWDILKTKCAYSEENMLKARSLRKDCGKILLIDDRVPNPTLGSGFPRSHSIFMSIREQGYAITLYPTAVFDEQWGEVYSVIPPDTEVIMGYGPDNLDRFLAGRIGYFDAIFVSRPHNMQYLRPIMQAHPDWFANVRIIYDCEALFTAREIAYQHLKGKKLSDRKIDQLIKSETELASSAEMVISVSPMEGDVLSRYGIKNVKVLGHAITPDPTIKPFEAREGILFVGSILEENSPNGDSVLWFIQEILPIIRKQIGCVSFTIAGTNKLVTHPTLAGENIRILGRIDDLSGAYNDARLFIAPTRYSAGIPHKIHEAASKGLPVAATSLLAKQLNWANEIDLLVGDKPAEFAKQCIRLHSEPQTWDSIRTGALTRIINECSPATFKANLKSILNSSNGNAVGVPHLTAVWRANSSSTESAVKFEA